MKLSLKKLLLTGFCLSALLTGGVGMMGLFNMASMNESANRMYERELLGLSYIKEANTDLMKISRDWRSMLMATTEEDRVAARDSLQRNLQLLVTHKDQARPLFSSKEALEAFEKIDAAYVQWTESLKRMENLIGQTDLADYNTAIVSQAQQIRVHSREIDNLFSTLSEIKETNASDAAQAITSAYQSSKWAMMIFIAIAFAAGLGMGITITRFVMRKIGGEPSYAAEVVKQIAAGDMTVNINLMKGDTSSLLHDMQQMSAKLSDVVSEVRQSCDSLATASEQVSATSGNLSQATSEQAASVEETTASVEEISASISQNSDNSKVTADISAKAARDASEGGEAVARTVEAMRSIADKVMIIDDIAYQTNLLALNAAIEAARAGDHGKGFAVVATEVRKLAERSQEAAQEIGKLAESSVEVAERAGELLNNIVPNIKRTSDLVQEITAASDEQKMAGQQISVSMTQLSQITQQNASASEELAATAEEMNDHASQLQNLVAFFKTNAQAMGQVGRVAGKAKKMPSKLAGKPHGNAMSSDFSEF